jgi:hypothetical protein
VAPGARGVADQHPADGAHGLAPARPPRGPAGHVPCTSPAVVPADADALPGRLGPLTHLRPRRKRHRQGGVQPPRGHPAHTPAWPRSWPRSRGSPMTVIALPGHPRRPTSRLWRARGGTVVGRRPTRRRPARVGAGPLHPGPAHGRGVQGGVMPTVKTIHRHPLVATARSWREARGSRPCPRGVMPRPQRRSHRSSMPQVRAPPTAPKVRTHRTTTRRLHAHAAPRARVSP